MLYIQSRLSQKPGDTASANTANLLISLHLNTRFSLHVLKWSKVRAQSCLIFQRWGSPFNLIKTFFPILWRIREKKKFKFQITWALLLAKPETLSAWKYLLWKPALPSAQHRQLWELFKQERSTDSRRLIWGVEGIRKWNLHWCAEGMERELPLGPLRLVAHLMGYFLGVENPTIYVSFIHLHFFGLWVLWSETR